MKEHKKRNNLFFLGGFTFYLLLIIIILSNIDKGDAVLYLNNLHNNALDSFFAYTTNLGDGIFYAIVVIFLLLFINYYYALIAALSFGLSSGLAQIFKKLVFYDAPRPKLFFEQKNIPLQLVEGVSIHAHNSFPSGHTTTAFSVFFLLAIVINRRILSILFLTIAILAGISRVYLAQHFLVDTFFGAILGVSSTYLMFYIFESFLPINTNQKLQKRLLTL